MDLGSGIRDPGSGIRKKPIPDPGSRGHKGTGSRIPDPDPQHWQLINLWGLTHRFADPDPLILIDFGRN